MSYNEHHNTEGLKMSKTCKNCGNTFEDHLNICPRCGMQFVADSAQYTTAQPYGDTNQYSQQNGYNQQNYGQQGYPQYQQPNYQQPAYRPYPAANEEMTVGNWLATIILTSLGFIGTILLFVWAFGSNVPTAKKNYCRAMLIMQAIALGLVIIFMIILGIAGASVFDEINNSYGGFYA